MGRVTILWSDAIEAGLAETGVYASAHPDTHSETPRAEFGRGSALVRLRRFAQQRPPRNCDVLGQPYRQRRAAASRAWTLWPEGARMNLITILRRALGIALPCALAAASGVVRAQAYAAAGLGLARQNLVCAAGAPCTENTLGGKALVGYRFDPAWTGEFAVLGSLGHFTASDSNGSLTWYGRVSMLVFGATGGYEFGPADWRFQARAGVAQVRGDFTSETTGVPDSSATTTQPLLGLGLRHELGAGTTLRLDWDITRGKAYQRQGALNFIVLAVEHGF
jgi:hypothetical protein